MFIYFMLDGATEKKVHKIEKSLKIILYQCNTRNQLARNFISMLDQYIFIYSTFYIRTRFVFASLFIATPD